MVLLRSLPGDDVLLPEGSYALQTGRRGVYPDNIGATQQKAKLSSI